jgi:hypothetical protein
MKRFALVFFILISCWTTLSWSIAEKQIPVSIRFPHGRPQLVREVLFNETLKWLRNDKKPLALEIARAISKSAAKYDHDPMLLLAMIIQESSVRPDARGRHGEIGLMQLKLNTARWLARRLHMRAPNSKQLFEPEVNIEFGAAYLSYLRDVIGPERFIQAYNSGPSAIRRVTTTDYHDRISKHYRELLHALAVTDDPSFASLENDVEPGYRASPQDSTLTPVAERSRKGSDIP